MSKTKKTSPTQRSLALLRKEGWVCQVVEHWNQFAMRRIDLFGCIDIVCLKPGVILGVQTTTAQHQAARITKIGDEPAMAAWLAAGGKVEVHGWSLKGARGERKTWQVNRTGITTDSDERPF